KGVADGVVGAVVLPVGAVEIFLVVPGGRNVAAEKTLVYVVGIGIVQPAGEDRIGAVAAERGGGAEGGDRLGRGGGVCEQAHHVVRQLAARHEDDVVAGVAVIDVAVVEAVKRIVAGIAEQIVGAAGAAYGMGGKIVA